MTEAIGTIILRLIRLIKYKISFADLRHLPGNPVPGSAGSDINQLVVLPTLRTLHQKNVIFSILAFQIAGVDSAAVDFDRDIGHFIIGNII